MRAYAFLCASALALTACGGGGSDTPSTNKPSAPPATPLKTVSGVAAASYPLVGKISIRDSAGKVKTQALQAGGSFSFDVSEMKSPFMLRASGEATDEPFVLHAAATNADGDGHYNVNPITDLIVAKAVGQTAAGYFDGGNYSNLTHESLTKQETAIQARIQPLLSAAGVPESVDLRRQAVAKDESGINAVLHVLEVKIDEVKHEVVLMNRLNGQKLIELLSQTTEVEGFKVDTDSAEVLREMPSIATIVKQHVELDYKTQGEQKLATLHPDFLDRGGNKDGYAKYIEFRRNFPNAESDNDKLRYFQVKSFQDKALAITFTKASYSQNMSGNFVNQTLNYLFKKDANNNWLAFGGRPDVGILQVKEKKQSSEYSCYKDCDFISLDLNQNYFISKNHDKYVKVVIYGPGLPKEGLVAQRNPRFYGFVKEWEFDSFKKNKYSSLLFGSESEVHILRSNPELQLAGRWPIYKAETFTPGGALYATELKTLQHFEDD
ncbi:hypothetical protein CSQ89_21155 [Chitinimonas sp. BJB300]|nr:hypothetical protein CSQ89_21155 [Chitinimonas sp. BJB300]